MRRIVSVEELDKNLEMTRRGFLGILGALGVQGLVDPIGLVDAAPKQTKVAKQSVKDFVVTVDGVDLTNSIRYVALNSEYDLHLVQIAHGDSFHSYAPGLMTTKFDMELLDINWTPPIGRQVDVLVRNSGVECTFSAYLSEVSRTFDSYDIAQTRCQFVANGAVTQKVVDKSVVSV